MPGTLVHLGAIVFCQHGGQAAPIMINPRVTVSGNPVITQASNYTISNCQNLLPAGGPCMTAQWITGAMRVFADGLPLVLSMSESVCIPNGTKLMIITTQFQVKGQ